MVYSVETLPVCVESGQHVTKYGMEGATRLKGIIAFPLSMPENNKGIV